MLFFFFFKQKKAYEMLRSLVGSEMCIRDNSCVLNGGNLRGGASYLSEVSTRVVLGRLG